MEKYRINKELIDRIATNARLTLSEKEIEKFTTELKDILEAFKAIDEINTENVKPSFHPQEISDVYRKDKAKVFEWDPLINTKHKEEKYFKGPRIV